MNRNSFFSYLKKTFQGRIDDQLMLHGFPSDLDLSLTPDYKEKMPIFAKHREIYKWLSEFANTKDCSVLEIGARKVQIPKEFQWMNFLPECNYTGFDVLPGENVDVVGDAHNLHEHFKPSTFDVVVSLAVFEHLAMPWLVAEEVTKVLKVGGYVAIETHFSFSEHELPWHFFQFNNRGLEILFNSLLGFEIIDSGMSNPIVGRFSNFASDYLKGQSIGNLYCHSSIIAKKVKEPIPDFSWDKVLTQINSMYPSPEKG